MGRKRVFPLFIIILTVICGATSCSGGKHQESNTWSAADKPLPEGAFKAEITVKRALEYVPRDLITEVEVRVKNVSNFVWPAGLPGKEEPYRIALSYRWLSKKGKLIADGLRKMPLPRDIRPGEEVIIYAKVVSLIEGDYKLQFDLVQEGVGWFASKGSRPEVIDMRVITKD